ncbi:MAG TPA: prolyl oligopeptidase family serine peptidase [Fimbriimonas sp.]|nr:prolyl oligopeptidase family serine peptidase [Fimbriimonas sp.]
MRRYSVTTLSLFAVFAAASVAQTPPAAPPPKRTMTAEDYKNWEALSASDITPDGHWIWYLVSNVDGDGYVVCKNNDDPRTVRYVAASRPGFSDDSKWFACLIGPPKAEAEKLREEKKPVETKLVLRSLSTGQEQTVEGVLSFEFLKGGKTLVARRYPKEPRPDAPSDVVIFNLEGGSVTPVDGVTDGSTSWNGSEAAFVVLSGQGDQGVELYDVAANSLKSLYWGKAHPRRLTFSKNGNALAFLLGEPDEKHEGDANKVVEFTKLPGTPQETVLDPHGKTWLTDGSRISETGAVALNDDGSAVAFGIGDWFLKHKVDDKVAHPEIWNSKDLRTVPEQRVTAGADRNRTDLTVWWPATNSVQVISHGWEQHAGLLKGFKNAVLTDSAPYASPSNDGFTYSDMSLVDTQTGKKTVIVAKNHWGPVASEEGNYVAYYKDRSWWLYDVKSGQTRNTTEAFHASFEDVEDDHTVPEKPPADSPTWLANDQGFLVGDEYDSYYIPVQGAGKKLTDGAKEHTVYRFVETTDEEDGPDGKKPLYFSSFNKEDKKSGFYVSDTAGKGKSLVMDDARFTGLRRARDADRAIFTLQSFDKSPNLYVTNLAFSQAKPESKTNPQQAKFYWPKSEIVSYKSRWGEPLQGILMYPANYVPGRSYPMVTYIYERLSDGLYSYPGVNEGNPYNVQILLQNGYFVFEPDIAYKGNTPGQNAVDCLEPAVAAVLAKKVGVNADRIGLMGHSWGGYQTAFVTTVSKVFRVGVAGAPLTDLVSMYNTHYWNVGIPNQPLLETGQGRLRVPFWDDPKVYIDNSPVWQSTKRKAPLLIEVGDQDGAVDYRQGIALYNTLRRMGKECILVLYYGENHGLSKRPDQLDYAHRLRHFMDVYLKDAKPEPWITQGVPFIRKDD